VATVSLSITTTTAPTAIADSLSVIKGASTSVNLANNDTAGTAAINRDSIVIVTQPANGSVTVGTNGNVTYQHNNSNTTTDSFEYTIKDINGLVSTRATVSVTVVAAATPPTAVANTLSVAKGGTASVNVANNDTNGTAAINRNSVVITTQPTNGSVTVGTDGNVSYQHNNTNTTNDSFAYTIKDINGLVSTPATVTVTVTPTSTPPTAVSDNLSVIRGGSTTGNLVNNDTNGTSTINRNSIVISTQPTNGSVTVGTDGNVTYLHNNSNTTTDSFAYTIRDINGLVSAPATVNISITPVNNQAPVATSDTATVAEGASTTIAILANDTTPTGSLDPASIEFTELPTKGTLVKNADGTVVYTHSGGESTSDTFKYTVKGTNGVVSNEATVSITITPTNDAPVANNDTATVVEGGSVGIQVLSNDSDIEGNIDPTSVLVVTAPTNGTVGVNPNTGVITYIPNNGTATSDSFTYTFKDTQGTVSNVATVTVTIRRKPVANDDAISVERNGQATGNLISNDLAPSGTLNPASIVITTQPTNGTVTVLGDGQVRYQHNGTASLSDSFAYTVADSNNLVSLPATVNVTITAPNEPPTTQSDTASVNEGESVDIDILANDGIPFGGLDPTSVTVVTLPTRGTANVLNSGAIRYTHSGGENTSDFLEYTVRGTNGLVSTRTRVDITITPTNDGPVAINDQASVQEGGTVNIPVLANDTDSDSTINAASVVIVNTPTHGTAVLGVGGVVEYTHNGSESTVDSFTYRVSDVSGKASNLATVSISITPVNDPPVAVNDAASIPSNVAAIVDLAANDFDSDDGLNLASIEIGTQPANGTLTVQADGKVSYVHNGSQATSDSFTYRIRDNSGQLSNFATVSLTITLLNQPPIAVADSAVVAAPGGQVVIDVAGNDSDPDGGLNLGSVVIITQPSNGTVTSLGNGSVRYTHDGSSATSDSFTYKIRDFAGELSNEATVTITVSPIA
jgi:VCBS repeat-containing protein